MKIYHNTLKLPALIFLFSLFSGAGFIMAQCDDPFIVNLGNDTVICEGGALFLDAGDGVNYVWGDGTSDATLLVTEPGMYFVTVTNECDKTDSDTIMIDMVANPLLSVNYPQDEYFCKGEEVFINAEVANPVGTIVYEWSNVASSDPVATVDTTGTYTVTARDEYGCESTREVSLEFQYPYEEEKILMVSYDDSENRNIVVWSRTDGKRTKEYEFYNGNTAADQMAIREFNTVNLVVDTETDPHLESRFYNMVVRDSCENNSRFAEEKAHKSIFLQVSEGQDGFSHLEWDNYEGFEFGQYYIFRGESLEEISIVDSIENRGEKSFTYTDPEAGSGVLYFYQVGVKIPEKIYLDDPQGKKAGSGPFVHCLSNLEDNRSSSGIENLQNLVKIQLYPNPSTGKLNVVYVLSETSRVVISLFSETGTLVYEEIKELNYPGEHQFQINRENIGIGPGVYFLRLTVDDEQLNKLIVFSN